ncbi:hypothetical protein POL68_00560 [Stigmatella sp. ncwal1]|uniref:DUF1449 family protein n=1 Tax=Stigmatella ashevillensis TaxID=2995309 RepID=A0ABT5CZV8_9BACT|nr:hypothetical protein [Stigmatella ashevillena]MDC0706954.1 hypothetical protein [Stigmatella ashevillena]
MTAFLDAILAFPTALLSILMGVVLVYWLCVILGAAGVDMLDGDVAAGAKAAGGTFEGGAKALGGVLEGSAKGAAEGIVGAAKAAKAVGGHDADVDLDAGSLSGLGFAGIPVTISGSFIVFASWTLSLLGSGAAHELLGAVLPGAVISGGMLLVSLLLGTFLAALAVRPLRPIFIASKAPSRETLMGRVCIINSGTVTGSFGQATFADGGAGLILNVFCGKANQLKRGDQALILGYDPARDVYEVEPVDWLLSEELGHVQDPALVARIKDRVS